MTPPERKLFKELTDFLEDLVHAINASNESMPGYLPEGPEVAEKIRDLRFLVARARIMLEKQ